MERLNIHTIMVIIFISLCPHTGFAEEIGIILDSDNTNEKDNPSSQAEPLAASRDVSPQGKKETPIERSTVSVADEVVKPSPIPLTDPSSAESAIDLLELESYVATEAYALGYELAKKMLPVWEADSTFDFLYGVHAIETGHFDEATFAFERLTLLYPKTLRYRLELARALYFNNNLDTAKSEFETALKSNPPEKVKVNILSFLDKINQTKEKAAKTHSQHWSIGVGVNAGFDSNINSGTEEDDIDIPNFGVVTLQKEAKSQSSAFTQFTTRGTYSYSPTKHHAIDLHFNSSHKQNAELSTYNLDVIDLYGGYRWIPLRAFTLQAGLTSTNVKLDGTAYQDQSTVNASAAYRFSNGFTVNSGINIGSRSSKNDNNPDADLSLYSISLIWPSSRIKRSNLSIYTGDDKVDEDLLDHYGKNIFGINYGTKLLITSNVIRTWLITVNSSEYQTEEPTFNEIRKDTAVMTSWGYTWTATKYMALNANFSLSHNSSNVDLYTSTRAILSTGINFNF